jgi:hypothetical protein
MKEFAKQQGKYFLSLKADIIKNRKGKSKQEFFISLVKVEKNGIEIKLSESDKKLLSFEDKIIQISWKVPGETFDFSLANKTDDTLRIIWNDAVFINHKGRSSKVIHYGVNYINKNTFQPDSVIIKHSTLTDGIMPTSNIDYFVDHWRIDEILQSAGYRPSDFRKFGEETVGKNLVVYLPISEKNKKIEYVFTFKIDDFKFDGQVLGGF